MTELLPQRLRQYYQNARDAHPGLLIQRGLEKQDDNDKEVKTQHIESICKIPASAFYRHAYERWRDAVADTQRFHAQILTLETRLFIGLTGGGLLETGCAVSHSYGMPYIPGSSIKGVVNAQVRRSLFAKHYADACNEIFGAEPSQEHPDGLAGLLSFYDAWWVPDSAGKPFVEEVVTTHHLDYYGNEGAVPASDLDSPVPNAQIAVQGQFLLVIEGPSDWLKLAAQMLRDALTTQGLGAKTRSGYGVFRYDEAPNQALAVRYKELAQQRHKVEAERQRQVEAQHKQAEREKLSELGRQRVLLEEEFDCYRKRSEMDQKQRRADLIGQMNKLLNQALEATDHAERQAVADALTRIYDTIGWGEPGQKKDKREKQAQKRRREIAGLSG